MNTELFIAKRIFTSGGKQHRLSQKIVNLALFGLSLGLMVMILAVAGVVGFKSAISDKVVGFGSHLQIVNYDSNQSFETQPVDGDQPFLDAIRQLPGVVHLQQFATKPGMIKTDDELMGVVVKGVGPDFDWNFFVQNKLQGEPIAFSDTARSNQVWISGQMADKLKLDLGDNLLMFFVNNDQQLPRVRRFEVGGIYKTSLEEFDQLFVLADMGHVQRLSNWEEGQVSGFEITLNNVRDADFVEMQVRDLLLRHSSEARPLLRVVNIRDKFPQIFDWLNLLDMNVWVLLSLMVLVTGFNMVAGLLVIILERTNMVGLLKAMGGANASIRKIFLYFSFFLILKALVLGNLLGGGLYLLQKHFHLIRLDPASYYVDFVPVQLSLFHLFLLNAGTIVVTILMLVAPSYFVSKISPDKTIRFD